MRAGDSALSNWLRGMGGDGGRGRGGERCIELDDWTRTEVVVCSRIFLSHGCNIGAGWTVWTRNGRDGYLGRNGKLGSGPDLTVGL